MNRAPPMDPEIKELWITALESGDYKQGRGQLRNSANEFCCLGVLCNLHAQAHPEFAEKQKFAKKYDGHEQFLPEIVQKWSGLKTYNGTLIMSKPVALSLAGLNDNGGSFKTITHYIRKYL